jgi:hypothetical protein
MKKIILLSICILFVFCNFSSAQSKKIRWESASGVCEYEGTFDSKKYTAAQLKNTQKLLGLDFNIDFTTATVWKYEEINSLNFAPIEAEYQKKSAELKNLNIVKLPYWEARKQQKLKEIEQYYWLIKTTMASYKTPKSLRDYPYAESCKTKYAEPMIAGGDSLVQIWEAVNIESRKNNSDPNRIKRIFDEQRASADALKFALVEVTAFGWWNCANAQIDQGDDYAIQEKNFRKLFSRIRTIRCDEP